MSAPPPQPVAGSQRTKTMRHRSLFLFALCAAAVYSVGALPSDADTTEEINYASSEQKVPCNNTINGEVTSATDVDGNVIKGCGNVVRNNTKLGSESGVVYVWGSDNVVEDNVIENSGGSIYVGYTDSASNGNVIVDNIADYIELYAANNNTVRDNVFGADAADRTPEHNTASFLASDADSNVVSDNHVDYMYLGSEVHDNLIRGNTAKNVDLQSSDNHLDIEDNNIEAARYYDLASQGTSSDDRYHYKPYAGTIFAKGSENVTATANAGGYFGLYHDANSTILDNDAVSDYFDSNKDVVVESNEGA